jgi:hypothetical protein
LRVSWRTEEGGEDRRRMEEGGQRFGIGYLGERVFYLRGARLPVSIRKKKNLNYPFSDPFLFIFPFPPPLVVAATHPSPLLLFSLPPSH